VKPTENPAHSGTFFSGNRLINYGIHSTPGTLEKNKLVGRKPSLKPKVIWAIRIHLRNAHHVRDLALFNLAIDSKLRCCDLVKLRVRDITHSNQSLPRAMVVQKKSPTTGPVCADRTDPIGGGCMDRKGTFEVRAVPLP